MPDVPDVLRFADQFHRPGPRSPVTWQGRIYFLEDVALLKPRVLRDLLRLHLRALRGLAKEIEPEITSWAARWRLRPVDPVRDDWPRAVALATLTHWQEYPEVLERLGPHWAFPWHNAPSALSAAEEADQRRARRGKRGRSRFQALAAQRGFLPTRTLRKRQAFTRLAQYQACKASLSTLAGSTLDNPKQVVKRGLRRTAELIGLRLRSPGKPGPRTGTRSRV